MTAQMGDSLEFEGKPYAMIGLSGTLEIDPEKEFGFKPRSGCCTACWNGYYCSYVVRDGHLRIDSITYTSIWDAPPPVKGIMPQRHDPPDDMDVFYAGLDHPANYTGGILAARDFIQELFWNMGYPQPWGFQEVHELIFEEGRLVKHTDCSRRMAKIRRKRLRPWFRRDGMAHIKQKRGGRNPIERAFDLHYDWEELERDDAYR